MCIYLIRPRADPRNARVRYTEFQQAQRLIIPAAVAAAGHVRQVFVPTMPVSEEAGAGKCKYKDRWLLW